MRDRYYTYVGVIDNTLYHRYIENGERHIEIVDTYDYFLYTEDENGDHISLYNKKLKQHKFNDICSMKEFAKNSEKSIYGNTNPVQQFISNEYPDVPQISALNEIYRTLNFDIEVSHDNGFPYPEKAVDTVLSISYEKWYGKSEIKQYYVGLRPYKGKQNDVEITILNNEKELLLHFLDVIQDFCPDFYTNWNGDGFDIPYLVNRCRRLFGKEVTKKLSPIYDKLPCHVNPIIKKRTKNLMYDVFGITNFDYMELYEKFSMNSRESYKLDHIAYVEVGENKVKFPEYKNNLMKLYRGEYDIENTIVNYDEFLEAQKELPEKDKWCQLRTMVKHELTKRGI